jgi:hypothetical protein
VDWACLNARVKVQTPHGPDYSYRCHSFVSGSLSHGRIWVGLPVAWHPRHSSYHHIDPVFARPLVERLFKVRKISRSRRVRGLNQCEGKAQPSYTWMSQLCLLSLAGIGRAALGATGRASVGRSLLLAFDRRQNTRAGMSLLTTERQKCDNLGVCASICVRQRLRH